MTSTTQTAIDTSAVEALGYSVEQTGETRRFRPVYYLNGARGARYGLVRCQTKNGEKSTQLCVLPTHRLGTIKARGYQYFTDEGGILRPFR